MLTVILPTYNEADNICPLIKDIFASCKKCEVIVVDDNSPDLTWKRAQHMIPNYGDNLRVIRRMRGRSLCASLNEGISHARGDVISWMDADFSMPPEKIPVLVAVVKSGADLAVGSRYVAGGSDDRDNVPLHRLLSRVLTWSASKILVPHFRDYTSGFIAIRKEKLHSLLPLQGFYGEYFIALIYQAYQQNMKIVEVPYHCAPRRAGQSKTATHFWDYLTRGWGYVRLIARLKNQ